MLMIGNMWGGRKPLLEKARYVGKQEQMMISALVGFCHHENV
jgi:hypothetical protein